MGWHTVAKVAQSFEGDFECRYCEYQTMATVFAKARGDAPGIGGGAEYSALENAERDGNLLAARTLQFVKCPRCGKTDPSGRTYRAQATIGAIAVGVVTAIAIELVLAIQAHDREDADLMQWVSLGFGVFIAAMLYWKWGRPWRSPDRRTTFR